MTLMRQLTHFKKITTNCSVKYDTNTKRTRCTITTFPFLDLSAFDWNRLWPMITTIIIQIWIKKNIRNRTTTRFAKVILINNKSKISMRRNIFTHLGNNNAQVDCPKRISYPKNEVNELAKIGNNKPFNK